MPRLVQLSRTQWVILAAFLFVTFPLLLALNFMPSLRNWYAIWALAPELERDLGFHAESTTHPVWGDQERFFIVDVVPGGAFDRAGIHEGDIPADVHHGVADFYERLRAHRGSRVELRILRISVGPADAFLVEHNFVLDIPRR